MADFCPYNLDGICKLTQEQMQTDKPEFYQTTCMSNNYVLQCPNFTRKDYAKKSYHFIEPSDKCPYLSGCDCELRGYDVCARNKSFYTSTCRTSRYHTDCSYYIDRVDDIKENRHFRATYRCPYLLGGICELRNVYMYDKHRSFYKRTCTTSNYLKKCPFFLEKIGKIKCPLKVSVMECCPRKNGVHCTVRNIDLRKKCPDLYNHCCSQDDYHYCCPYYVEDICDD